MKTADYELQLVICRFLPLNLNGLLAISASFREKCRLPEAENFQ